MIPWPIPSKGNVQEFFCTGAVWHTWTKPKGADMAFILCIGGGASGGGGLTAAAGSARGGGGGGGASGITRIFLPVLFLPDILYVQVGSGGASVGAGTLGNPGAISYVSLIQSTNSSATIITSGNAAAAGGAAGTSAGSNAGGNGGTAFSNANAYHVMFGIFTAIAGQNGSASGAISGANGAAGVAITWANASTCLCGGSGGGTVGTNNTDFAGGAINGIANLFPTINGGVAAQGAGNNGSEFEKPLRCGGGSGGGTGGAAGLVGGRGGDGALGCGGGGGGGGTTGGSSGRGGDGYVAIISW